MTKILTEDQIAAWHSDGCIFPIRAVDPDEAQENFDRYTALEKKIGEEPQNRFKIKAHLPFPWMWDIIRNDNILDAVEDIIGPDILCWGSSFFTKNAHDTRFVSWHQDSTYWGLDKPDVVTAWVALSPATRESGCMKMMPGTHALDQMPHRDTLAEHNLLTRGQEVAVEVDESKAVHMELAPGEISLHHVRTVHASEPNRSDDRRIGVALRYIAPHVRQRNGERDSAMLVRGEDTHGNFVHEAPPKRDMDADALEEHARIMRLRQDILYDGVAGKPAHLGD